MGKKDSSSKKKPSKQKSSKITYQKKKKKIRKTKLKKAKDVELSISSYSDDESKSLLSGSKSDYSSSSGDDHKARKGRSRARGEAKSSKKKVNRRSSSVESIPKKRKRSKKDVKLRPRRKSRKSKRKRDVSLSSVSDSHSYTCSSGEEREPRRKRGRSSKSKKHKRNRSKVKIKTRNSRSESPSSYSRDSHHTDSISHVEKEISPEYKPRRIRSVITVVRRQEEDQSEKDRYEEEMVYDRYDYPSPRSNDSNDGVSKKKSAYYSNIALDKTETGGDESIDKEDLGEYDVTDPSTRAGDPDPLYATHEAEIKHGDVSSAVSEPTEDLELLLRQKALENLRKFRVEKQRNIKTNVNQSETRFNETSSEISEKEKNNISTVDVNVKLGASRQETVISNPETKPRPSSQAPAKSSSLTPSFDNNQATGLIVGVSSATGNELEVSETSLEKIATEQEDQSKDGSQYEKKTMSVMRGGEMVQVSYKVYIPKKTPALHRRQLRR